MSSATKWNMYPGPGYNTGPTAGKPGWMSTPRDPYPTWMFAGRPCTTREFADFIWPEDDPQKTAFLLRWEGFAQNP